MNNTAVVILNWNGAELLKTFLPSVINFTSLPDVEIYVADNHSNDNSIEFLKKEFPSIKIIQLDNNYGFAGGYNKALKRIDSKYFVLLNSDIEVSENWLQPLINLMNSDKTIAACMPKILSYKQKDEFEYAGAAGGFIDKYGFSFCRGRIFNYNEKDTGQYNIAGSVFWATGACLMIRSDVFNSAGGLDEEFFAHMEEIDLCWRIKNRGMNIYYCPDSKIYHLGGATLNKTNPKKTYLNFRNNLYMLYKNLPKGKVFNTIFTRMLLDGIAGLNFLAHLEFKNFFSVIKAHFAFYFNVSKFKSKRATNLKHAINFSHPEMFKRSIVRMFFFKKIKKFSELEF